MLGLMREQVVRITGKGSCVGVSDLDIFFPSFSLLTPTPVPNHSSSLLAFLPCPFSMLLRSIKVICHALLVSLSSSMKGFCGQKSLSLITHHEYGISESGIKWVAVGWSEPKWKAVTKSGIQLWAVVGSEMAWCGIFSSLWLPAVLKHLIHPFLDPPINSRCIASIPTAYHSIPLPVAPFYLIIC